MSLLTIAGSHIVTPATSFEIIQATADEDQLLTSEKKGKTKTGADPGVKEKGTVEFKQPEKYCNNLVSQTKHLFQMVGFFNHLQNAR